MYNSKQSHQRVRLLAVLSIVMLLASVIPWFPASAQESTAVASLNSLSIACAVEGGDGIVATAYISNAPLDESVTVTIDLYADTSPTATKIGEPSFQALSGETEVSLNLRIPADTANLGASTVSARAYLTGGEGNPIASTQQIAIYAANGMTLCGTPPAETQQTETFDTTSDTDSTTDTTTDTDSTTDTTTDTDSTTDTTTDTDSTTDTTTDTDSTTDTTTDTDSTTDTSTDTDSDTDTDTTPTTQFATVVNTGGANLYCRAAPVSGSPLGRFPAGASVELRGEASGGWYPVVCPNGEDGYSSADYLQVDSASTPTDPDDGDGDGDGDTSGVATVKGTDGAGLRCRTEPVNGSIINVYPDGTRLDLRGSVENGWAPVNCGGTAGWISTQYATIDTDGSTSPDPDPDPDPGSGTGKYGTVVNTGGMGLRCRTAPVSGAIILVAPEGTKLETRGAASSNWYPVVCNGQAGYVSGDYFTLSDGGTTTPPVSGGSDTAMVSGTGGGGLRCRTAPVDGGIITVMPEGTLVDVRGDTTNGWVPVKCSGQNGWASAAYLNFNISGGGTGELWMDVDLGDQYMRVYRGNTVIAQTYVSTGRPGFDTPTGTYYINYKLRSQTMSGVLGGEYYYVPNVPWVMYFTNRGHAIHGAYWHNNFGHVMSHGCINLPVGFSEWLYSVTPYGARLRIHW